MPKRKQGELDNEGVQDFELIELLIRETGAASSTSTQQGGDFESFKARFQSYVDQIPSYLHSVGKEGFFSHFFLGSFSTLVDTEIATKLNIEKIYFSFGSSKTLKVAVIKKGEIKSPEDVADKVKLFVIAESGSTRKKFSYGELDKILGNTKVARNNVVRLARDQGKLGVRLVEITKKKDAKGKMAGIYVNVESNKLDNDASTTHEFKEIKKGLWNNPESDIAELTNSDVKIVKEFTEKILKKVSGIHSEYKNSLTYAQGTREAAHHGFVAGALVSFRYRHNLRVYLEEFTGRGYADIVLVPRGKDRSLNSVPIIIELKAGTSSGTTSNNALEQAKDYAKGFQLNTMRVLTISDNVLCVGLNLDSTESEKFSMYISPPHERKPAPPTIQKLLEVTSSWNGEKSTITDITEKIKQPLERIYHTFPGTPEKGDNYFSRFLLGQLLLANEFKRINLEKSVFLYNEYPLVSSTRSGAQSTERPVTTFMLTKGNQGQNKEVFIFHIREGGKGEFSEKKIPINLPTVSKITEVCISLQEERKSDFFDVEKVNRYNSLDEYRQGKSFFVGEWKNIPYPAGLKETFDEVLNSQVASSQDQSQLIGKYKELFGKLGETVLPFKVLIEKEAHIQAISHGAFSHYSDIKLGELQENRALVLTEFQTGRGKRIDMLVHGIKFAEVASNAKEYCPIGIEIKGPREGKDAVGLLKEADNQIEKEYKEGVTYKTLTDGDKVFIMGVVFDNKAQSSNSLIKITNKLFSVNVIHSSKVKGNIDKLKRPALHKLFNRGLNALRSFEVHSGGAISNWVDIGRDRLKDSNKNLINDPSNTFFKSDCDFQSYLNQIPEDISTLDLSEMDLGNYKMGILSNFLEKHKNINSIDLSYNEFNSVQVSGLISFLIRDNRKISFLDLSQNDIGSNGSGSEAIESLARLIETNNIDSLTISNIEMESDDFSKIFRALKKNTSIKSLDCSLNKVAGGFNQDDVKTIVDFLYNHPKLTALNLANTGVNDHIIKGIEGEAQKDYQGKTLFIEELDIGNYNTEEKITKEGIKSLAKLLKQASKLKSLRLSGNPIRVEGLKELVTALRNTDIETLDISETSLECNQDNAKSVADIMKGLIGELNLRELDLSDNQLNAKAIGEIFSSMKNRKEQVLKELDLAGNFIGDEIKHKTLEAISSSLQNNDVLESLNLANVDLGGTDIEEIVGALRKETIVDLDISGNDIYESTMQEVLEFLQDNSRLRFLNIASHDSEKIPLPEGIENLFQTLKDHNKVLTHLNIGGYVLNDKSINIIAKYLGSDIGIQYLSLAGSKFTEDKEQALNVLFEALKNSDLQLLDARDISITDRVIDKIIECFEVNENLQVLHISQDQLSKSQVKRLERASLKTLVQVDPRFPANFGCPQKVKRGSSSSEYPPRRERSVSMACVDSFDEEKITEEEKEQRIKELFNADKVAERVKNIEFYDQLFKVSRKISEGEIIDKNVEEAFVAKIKDVDLNSIDPEIRDIVKEMKDNIENKEEVKNVLRRSGVTEKIGKVAEGAGLAFTAFLVGKHIANGDIEGLGYDALNLWVMPKIGEKISGKILGLGTKLDSQMLKEFAPAMGRTIGNFAAFLGLAESIKARQNATDPVDIKIADLNIATNSIFIAADVPAVVTETMSAIGMEAGVIGEFAGPVGAAVSVVVIIIAQFVEAGLEVEKLEEHIKLTDQEKHDLYWDFFLGKKVPDYIKNDLQAEEIYKQYISKVLDNFDKDNYTQVVMSLPSILIKKEEYATNSYSRSKRQWEGIGIGMLKARSLCHRVMRIISTEFDFEQEVRAKYPFYNIEIARNFNRVVPSTIGSYNLVCRPQGDDVAKQIVSTQELAELPVNCDPYDSESKGNQGAILKKIVERWFLQEHMTDCYNAVSYNRSDPSGPVKMLFYMSNNNAFINVTSNYTIDVIFNGKNILLNSYGINNQGSGIQNRYYFTNQLSNCDIHKQGTNFFYIAKDNFVCNLGGPSIGQNNIVVTRSNFTDSENIHSIIGSDKANYIEVSHASYVDGKGGNDVIMAKNFTTIKGYFGDSIHGKGLVLLPINLSDIGNITHANNITNIYNKSGAFISVDKQTSVKTADGLSVTPTKVDTNTGRVTNLHVTKSIGSNVVLDDELDNLRKIDNLNFNVTKQLSSTNYHSTIGSSGNHIFYPDKEHHNFYWEAPSNISHLYLFDSRSANITIAQANGILDFSQLNCTLDDIPFIENKKGEIKINKNGLNVTLLPNYKDVTVTFNGEEYYKLQNGELERDYCSHSLRIDGRFSVNGTDLLNHHNCFTFDSEKVLFLKLNNNLLLLSDRGALSISDYYSSVNKNWDLSIELNNRIMEPEEFGERADDFSSFRYYKPDEQGLQIYHNQPINKNDIGLVDLKDKSILDFDMKVINNNLLLSYKNNTLVKVENWNSYQPAREMMFAFNDKMVSNSKCIASTCNSGDVIVDFNEVIVGILKLNKELLLAVRGHELNEVKNLISQGASLEAKDDDDNTPLHWASWNSYLDVVDYLIKSGTNLEAKNRYGRTPLFNASWNDHLDVVKYLVENGANLEAKDYNGKTPLHMASLIGHLDVVKYLVENGANLEAKDYNGKTPLHMASLIGHLDVVKYLISKGADINAKANDGKTPLDIAIDKKLDNVVAYLRQTQLGLNEQLLAVVRDGDFNKVKDLVGRGASLDIQDSNNGWTPIIYAAQGSKWDMVKFLIAQGAKFNNEITYQGTPLHFAAQEGNSNMVQFLLDKGADIEAQNAYNKKPLHLAVEAGKLKVVRLLLDRGANIKAADMYGQTPLDLAIKKGYEDIVEVLKQKQLDLDKELLIAAGKGDIEKVRDSIRQGANVNVQGRQGWTPVFWAIQKNNFNIIELLLDNNADIKVKDNQGWTPLHWAVQLGSLDVVERLVERGADVNALTADGRTPYDLAINQNYREVKEYLRSKSAVPSSMLIPDDSVRQRKRRHHHGDHSRNHNHSSHKFLSVDSSNQPEIAASSGTRPSLWINGLFGWVKGSVGGLFYSRAALSEEASNTASSIPQVDEQFAKASVSSSSSTSTTLPSDGTDKKQENGGFFRDNIDYVNANIKQMRERQTPVKFKPSGGNTILEMGDHYLSQIDFNGTIMLLDLLIRKVTGQKYISTVDQSISSREAQGYVLNITKGFEKVVEQAALKSGISMHRLNIDYMGMQKEITRKVMSGKFNEISGILKSYVEKACPDEEAGKLSPKKFEKFIAQFNKGLLNQSIEQILHNRDGRLEVDDAKQMSLEPQSYLSNASVHSHSEVSTCLSEIGVTKLGGNLNR